MNFSSKHLPFGFRQIQIRLNHWSDTHNFYHDHEFSDDNDIVYSKLLGKFWRVILVNDYRRNRIPEICACGSDLNIAFKFLHKKNGSEYIPFELDIDDRFPLVIEYYIRWTYMVYDGNFPLVSHSFDSLEECLLRLSEY